MADQTRQPTPPAAGMGSLLWNYMRYGLWQRHRLEQKLAGQYGDIYSIRTGQVCFGNNARHSCTHICLSIQARSLWYSFLHLHL
jgi:hypothetical protein